MAREARQRAAAAPRNGCALRNLIAVLPPPSPLPAGPPMTPPGWYRDPWTGTLLRYWDGAMWTGYTAPGPPEAPEPEPRPVVPLVAAVWAIVVTAGSLVLSRFVIQGLAQFRWPIAAYIAVSVLIGYGPIVAYCWWASRRWCTGRLGHDFGFRFRIGDTGWGPLTWLSAYAAAFPVVLFIRLLDIPIESNTRGLRDFGDDRGVMIATGIAAVICAPFVEELVFRGVILNGFRSVMSAAPAIALQAVIFGSAHIDPSRGVGNIGLVMVLSAVGGVLGTSAYLVRRLGSPIIAHMLYNAVALTMVFFVIE